MPFKTTKQERVVLGVIALLIVLGIIGSIIL